MRCGGWKFGAENQFTVRWNLAWILETSSAGERQRLASATDFGEHARVGRRTRVIIGGDAQHKRASGDSEEGERQRVESKADGRGEDTAEGGAGKEEFSFH